MLLHQPYRLPLTRAFRGNPWRQLLLFPAGVPLDLSVQVLTNNGLSAGGLTQQPTVLPAGTNRVSVGYTSTNDLPDACFITYSWGGRVQMAGEVQLGRGLQVGNEMPLLTITPTDAQSITVNTSSLEVAEVLAEARTLMTQVQNLLSGISVNGTLLTALETPTVAAAAVGSATTVQLLNVLADEDYDGTMGFYLKKGTNLYRIRTAKR